MKQILLAATLLLLLFPAGVSSQIIESFSGPEIISANPWEGDKDMFSINSSGQLKLTSPKGETGEASLYLPVVCKNDMSWEISVRFDFKSSNSNNARIAVYSDDDILYYIQAGNNNGQISFYSKDGTKSAKLCIKGRENLMGSTFVAIRLTLTDGEVWTLYTRASGETDYYEEGSFAMKYLPYMPEAFMQIICRYIKSRTSSFYFDDIHISTDIAESSPKGTVAELTDIQQLENNKLQFIFSAPVNISNASCEIDEIGKATNISYGDNSSVVVVTFAKTLEEEKDYYLEWENLFDLTTGREIDLALILSLKNEPDNPVIPDNKTESNVEPGEIIFNELLPNPFPEGSEYIELYNRSGHAVSLQGLAIAIRKSDGTLLTAYPLSGINVLIEKDDYALLSKSIGGVSPFYTIPSPKVMHEVKLPVLSNTSSTLVLFRTKDGMVIDEVSYSSHWHASSIKSQQGVALERIDPEGLSQDASNWTSATPAAGYGTPGYQNSQFNQGNNSSTHIEPPVLAPDGTYLINYQLNGSGYNCRAFVYGMNGHKVAEIAGHTLLSTSGQLIWNGQGLDGKRIPTGVYIFYMELYNYNGKTINTRSRS